MSTWPCATAARGRQRDHAADAGLGEFQAGRHQAGVGRQRAVGAFTEQVETSGVGAVHVLEHAVLFHHEHLGAQLQQGIQVAGMQGIKRQAAPGQVRGRGAQARTSLNT
ncbi:hypothetical protein ACFJGX_17285 [Hydrogenophaga sp. UC242_50]|uniref:hypothetical protein n=1 Tax=Hydrogenophaga sp. UC242_50 TaxID=3350169 RepID=UPI0036D20EAC